jgi:hypothetical protein
MITIGTPVLIGPCSPFQLGYIIIADDEHMYMVAVLSVPCRDINAHGTSATPC